MNEQPIGDWTSRYGR